MEGRPVTASENGSMPAHPTTDTGRPGMYKGPMQGLTKREVFAMAALQGALANSADGGFATDQLARVSVLAADRLLAELAKVPNG